MHIETDRIIVRDFTPNDAADLHAILGDAETMKHCEPAYTFEQTSRFLQKFCIERRGAVAAALRETGKVIGYMLFNESGDGVYEIGWIFNRAYWRQGYAFEACHALIDHAFGHLNAHKLFAETIDTEKSVPMMKKLGMQPEGVQRSHTKDACGNWVDLYLFGLLAK